MPRAEIQPDDGQVAGVARMLENRYGWRDVRTLVVESVEKQCLIIEVSPELAVAVIAGTSIVGLSGILVRQVRADTHAGNQKAWAQAAD